MHPILWLLYVQHLANYDVDVSFAVNKHHA